MAVEKKGACAVISYFGEFEIVGKLGAGGSAVVYRAIQRNLDREVALKIIHGHASEEATMQFRLAAEAMAALDHPNIVSVYEIGEHDGRLFYSMEIVEPGAPGDIAKSMAAIADAVTHAHARGVLHGDLKPSNILFSEDGTPVVADFAMPDHGHLGSPPYMAPELLAESGLTTAVDVYGIGAVLFERLTGHPPFKGKSTAEISRKVIEELPVLPKGADPELALLCLNCLAKDPAERPASASQLEGEFRRIVRGVPIQTRRISRFTRLVKWCKRRPLEAGLAGVTVFVLFLGTALPAMRIFPKLERPDRFGAGIDVHKGVLAVGVPSTNSVEVFDIGERIQFRKQIDFKGHRMGRSVAVDDTRVTAGGFENKYLYTGVVHSVPLETGELWVGASDFKFGMHGASVVADDEWIWGGSPGYVDGTGCVIQYAKTGQKIRWVHPQIPRENRFFGDAIASDGQLAVIGAPGRGSVEGMIVLIDPGNEAFYKTMSAGGDAGRFGWALDISEGILLVGAPGEDDNRGAVYLVDLDSATIRKRIAAPAGAQTGDSFGEAVALFEGHAVIGAPQRPGHRVDTSAAMPGHGPGYVVVIDIDSGKVRHRLQAPGGEIGDSFGENLRVGSGRIFVTAERYFYWNGLHRHPSRDWGRVEVFDFETGKLKTTLHSHKASAINWKPVWIYGFLAVCGLLIFFWKKK